MLEIERKFLLKKIPFELFKCKTLFIQQFYGNNLIEGQFRIREELELKNFSYKTRYILTKKINKQTDLTKAYINEEIEREIDKKEFEQLKLCCDKQIAKTRLIFNDPIQGLKWEIDNFRRMRLIIAEVEFPSEDYPLVIPEEIKSVLITEVTSPCFSNFNLAEPICKSKEPKNEQNDSERI